MTRMIILWLLVPLTVWTTGSCYGEVPLTDSTNTGTAISASPEPDKELAKATITKLAFTGNGDTFLESISTAMDAYDGPVSHRYVEIRDGGDQNWQGESLIDGDRQRVYLQRMHKGGAGGLLIETTASADIQALVADIEADSISTPHTFPEIRFVRARETNPGVWSFDVTLAYPDTGWEDYADGWHVESGDGHILATRILLHPHVNEQPFTRSLGGVSIPDEIETIKIRSHALVSGYGPEPLSVPLNRSATAEHFEVKRYE